MRAIYHAGASHVQEDGAIVHHTNSFYQGDMLVKISNCRLENLAGDMRRTVYATGAPATYFSIPAACIIQGCRVRGYITGDGDGNLVFQQCYY